MQQESSRTGQPRRMPPRLAARVSVVLASALALAVVMLVPHLSTPSGQQTPPVGILLLVGGGLAAVIAPALYLAVRSGLGLGAWTAACVVAYNLLVILVKFVLAPHGLYKVNQSRAIDSMFSLSQSGSALVAAGTVFLLYLAVYVVLYRLASRKLGAALRRDPGKARRMALPLIVGALLVAISLPALGIALLLLAGSGLSYLEFVFSSGVAAVVALALACAIGLASHAFTSAAERARAVGGASMLVSLFWLGLYFLALYHALWVVYILVLTSVWPLKTVTTK
jgi:hypothetical protein